MKQFFKVAVATAAFATSAFAQAALIDINPVYTSNTKLSGSKTSAGFEFNLNQLTFDGFAFKKGVDTIESALLTFRLSDNGNDNGSNNMESYAVQVYFNTIYSSPSINVPNGGANYPFQLLSSDLLTFSTTGLLTGNVTRLTGDFTFNTVTLNASIRQGQEGSSAEVPEPLGATLFGIGMVGLLAARRKAKA